MPPITNSVLALIPAYNEADHITRVVAQTCAFIPTLVVDDGSRDSTASLAEQAGAVVLLQQPNQGKGAALKAGFRYAIEHNYAAILTLDADGQHDPAEIPAFLETWQRTQADLIIGERNFAQMPLVRRVANTIGRKAFSWALGQHITDNQSGYRLVSRRMAEATLASAEAGFEFEVEMVVICVRQGLTLAWTPIRTIYADEKSHITPLAHGSRFIKLIWRVRRSRHSQ